MKAIYKGLGTKNMANLAKGKEYHVRLSTGYQNGRHVIRLTLDDDSKCAYSSVQMFMKDWGIVEEEPPAFMETLAARDARIEDLAYVWRHSDGSRDRNNGRRFSYIPGRDTPGRNLALV